MKIDPDSKPTVEDLMDSMNGYDERDVATRFGLQDLVTDLEAAPMKAMRALVMVHQRHALGVRETGDHKTSPSLAAEAYEAAMLLTLTELGDYFAETPEPGTDAASAVGEGAAAPGAAPSISPTSVSGPELPPAKHSL